MAEKRISDFRAIATAYRSFLFRSRLEAKWAVFFDLCGWRWSYEPFDLNGWIPDFAIGERPTLVEIKPFFKIDQWKDAKAKIVASGCVEPVILLGADASWLGATPGNYETGAPQIGWLFEPVSTQIKSLNELDADNGACEVWEEFIGEAAIWETSELHFGVTEGNGKFGVCPLGGGWVNNIWVPPANASHPNKWSRVWLNECDIEANLIERWAQACNISQWIPTQ